MREFCETLYWKVKKKKDERNSTPPGNVWIPPAARSAETVLDPSDAAFER